MAVKERDNFEEVTVMAKVPRKDANGKRVKEVIFSSMVQILFVKFPILILTQEEPLKRRHLYADPDALLF